MNSWRGPFTFVASLFLAIGCGGATVDDGKRSSTSACAADGGTSCATDPPKTDRVCRAPMALPSSPCADGYYLYADSIGGPGPDGTFSSSPVGDQLCHQSCETDADCSDPCRPACHTLGLFSGGDWNCNGRVRVCGTRSFDDC
jgi:hypothetical protein